MIGVKCEGVTGVCESCGCVIVEMCDSVMERVKKRNTHSGAVK